ncbi:uncharacterized protein LOC105844911 [Hydra vulgaris]|uniref:uncharacterized protein LOC105844911 n=1 Tax=Hydra vulgaris TaxID=6087 RepID=UPI001F5F0339|nr:uncharacterized protein LOC105844911 [Hydra vulgaris]
MLSFIKNLLFALKFHCEYPGIESFGHLGQMVETELKNSTTNSIPVISRREIANPKGIEPLSGLPTGIETDLFSLETKLSKPIFKREVANPKVQKRDANSYRLFKEIDNYKKKFQRGITN